MRLRTASWCLVLGAGALVGCGDDATTSAPGATSPGTAGNAGSTGKAGASGGGTAGAGLGGKAGASGGGQAATGGTSGGQSGAAGSQAGAAGSGGDSGAAGASAGGTNAGSAGTSAGGTAGGNAGANAGGNAGANAGGNAGANAGGNAGANAGGSAGANASGAGGNDGAGAGGMAGGGAGGGKVFACTEAADCSGPGTVCDPILRECVPFATCGSCDDGYTCQRQGQSLTSACYLECDRAANDCPGGMTCSGCAAPDDCGRPVCRYPGGAARGAPCEVSATLSGCAAGLACVGLIDPVCLAVCDFASAAPTCPSGESCHPDGICRPTTEIDPAAIDALCDPGGGGSGFGPTYCAVAGGKVRGSCFDDGVSPPRCRAFCKTAADCGSGTAKICLEISGAGLPSDSVCVPDPVGKACADAEECGDSQRFVCEPKSGTCQLPCDETRPCTGGAFCASRGSELAACHATCVLGGSGCPAGSACLPIDGTVTVGTCKTLGTQNIGELCAPGDKTSGCVAGARCVGFVCRKPCDYWGGGATCAVGEACAPDGVCLDAAEVDSGNIGGFCDAPSFPDPADIACGGVTGTRANGRCARSRCEKPCRVGQSDCAAGESCFAMGVGEELGACYPDSLGAACAGDQDCQDGSRQTCDPTTKKCIPYACNATTCLTNRCAPDQSGEIACDESCKLGDPPSVCGASAVCASIDLAGAGICTPRGTSGLGGTCDATGGTTGCTGDLVCTEDAAGDFTCQPRCDGFAASGNACGPNARCAPAIGACVNLPPGRDRPALGDSCENGPSEPSFCGDDGKVFRGLCASTGKQPSCKPICRTNADCAPGLACVGEGLGYPGVCL